MDWTAFGAVTNAIAALLVFGSLVAVLRQLTELRRSTDAQAYSTLLSNLQEPMVRRARKHLIALGATQLSEWTVEDRELAEVAINSYDTVAIMVRHDMMPKQLLLHWRDSILACWSVSEALVEERRTHTSEDYWEDFQWLAGEATRHGWKHPDLHVVGGRGSPPPTAGRVGNRAS